MSPDSLYCTALCDGHCFFKRVVVCFLVLTRQRVVLDIINCGCVWVPHTRIQPCLTRVILVVTLSSTEYSDALWRIHCHLLRVRGRRLQRKVAGLYCLEVCKVTSTAVPHFVPLYVPVKRRFGNYFLPLRASRNRLTSCLSASLSLFNLQCLFGCSLVR